MEPRPATAAVATFAETADAVRPPMTKLRVPKSAPPWPWRAMPGVGLATNEPRPPSARNGAVKELPWIVLVASAPCITCRNPLAATAVWPRRGAGRGVVVEKAPSEPSALMGATSTSFVTGTAAVDGPANHIQPVAMNETGVVPTGATGGDSSW